MDKPYSNFDFLEDIIQLESDPELKEKLGKILEVTKHAETQASIDQDSYRSCILDCGVACDTITNLLTKKLFPEEWDALCTDENGNRHNPGMNDIWTQSFYAKLWETDQKSLQMYLDLFDLKGEYNCAHHEGKKEYTSPLVNYLSNGTKQLKKTNNKKYVAMDKKNSVMPTDAEFEHMMSNENALRRLRLVFEFLCATLVKCGYLTPVQIPVYKEPKGKSLVNNGNIESLHSKTSELSEDVKNLKETVQEFIDYRKSNDPPISGQNASGQAENTGGASGSGITGGQDPGPGSKPGHTKALIAVLLVLVVALGVIIGIGKAKNNSIDTAEGSLEAEASAVPTVYYSKVLPMTDAGKVQSYTSSYDVTDTIETNDAVSLLSFIKNEAPEDAVVEDISVVFEEIEENNDPVLKADAFITDNVLKIYAMNDGFGPASDAKIDIVCENPELSSFADEVLREETIDLEAGEVTKAAEYALDPYRFEELNIEGNVTAYVNINGELAREITIEYHPDAGEFKIFTGGYGDGMGTITLFSVVDVKAKPEVISFKTEDITTVDDTLRIETVLAPTQSCRMKFKGMYSINGNTEETDQYTATVTVPYYIHGVFFNCGALTKELAEDPDNSKDHMMQIAQKYKYDPEILNPNKE